MFLKAIEEETNHTEDEDEDEDEDITIIAKKIRKLLQYRRNDKNKAHRKLEYFRKAKSDKPLI